MIDSSSPCACHGTTLQYFEIHQLYWETFQSDMRLELGFSDRAMPWIDHIPSLLYLPAACIK